MPVLCTVTTSPRFAPILSLMTRFAYLCLENQAVVRDKDARTTLIDLIGVLVQKFNHGLSKRRHSRRWLPTLSLPR